jgi:hypothetical protein
VIKIGFAGMIVIEASEAGAPVIVSANDVVCERAPPAPVIVMFVLPTRAEAPAFIVRMEFPEPAEIELGANWAVTPDGVPVAVSDTAEEKPPTAAELTMSVALVPTGIEIAVGETDRTKSGTPTLLTV